MAYFWLGAGALAIGAYLYEKEDEGRQGGSNEAAEPHQPSTEPLTDKGLAALKRRGGTVVYTASWCNMCRYFKPTVAKAGLPTYEGADDMEAYPTIVRYSKGGEEVKRQLGMMSLGELKKFAQ